MKKDLRKTEINFIIDEWDRNFTTIDEQQNAPGAKRNPWGMILLVGLVAAILISFLLTALYLYVK